jgi:hypothetical protein
MCMHSQYCRILAFFLDRRFILRHHTPMQKTSVVNLRLEKCDVKITRTPKNEIPDPPNFGCFGNPYPVKTYGRERCLELYREYFYKRINEDIPFREAVLSLRNKKLGCFCKPDNACHGDIIKEWLDNNEQ